MKLQKELEEQCNDSLQSITFWDKMKGGASGGTSTTLLNYIKGTPIKTPWGVFDPFLCLQDGTKSSYEVKAQNATFIAPSQLLWDDVGHGQC